MKKLYLDTNIYVSKYKDEFHLGGMPAYARYSAEQLLERTIACEFFIVSSDLVLDELNRKFSYYTENLNQDLSSLHDCSKLLMLNVDPYVDKARRIDKDMGSILGWRDCAHLLMCRDVDAIFVSWERKLVRAGQGLGLEVLRPEEL